MLRDEDFSSLRFAVNEFFEISFNFLRHQLPTFRSEPAPSQWSFQLRFRVAVRPPVRCGTWKLASSPHPSKRKFTLAARIPWNPLKYSVPRAQKNRSPGNGSPRRRRDAEFGRDQFGGAGRWIALPGGDRSRADRGAPSRETGSEEGEIRGELLERWRKSPPCKDGPARQ